jgi:antitoxin component of MazEF toxin-antitoxin module
MKLQKQLSREVQGKKYPKWVVTIPPEKVHALGWKTGEELEAVINDNKLVLAKKEKGHYHEQSS